MAESERAVVERIYRAAVAGADPAECVRRALVSAPFPGQRTAVIGLGKAARAMSAAAGEMLGKSGLRARPIQSLVLDADSGDHPIPGPRSERAANDLAAFLTQLHPGDHVLILLSGGTSSLIAAPTEGVSPKDLSDLFRLLLESGLDIHQINQVRKRWSRWGAGRLGQAAGRASLPVHVLVMSDVSGDRLESIGSGPCMPDPSTAADIVAFLKREKLWDRIPGAMQRSIPETPKPGDPAFDHITHRIVANNQSALDGAIRCAGDMGYRVERGAELGGDAAQAGRSVAQRAKQLAPKSCLVQGGETTVRLERHSGLGGRCQELALAAAMELEQPGGRDITILAAGTDGRDGPTDAAGAIVDANTAPQIRAGGLDPLRFLHEHNAYPALNSVGALLRTGPTGTNVRDVVVALRM